MHLSKPLGQQAQGLHPLNPNQLGSCRPIPSPTCCAADWLRQEDARPEALLYDSRRCRLLTAGPRPALWDHLPARSDKGHSGRLVAALYNSAFHVVGGWVGVWVGVVRGWRFVGGWGAALRADGQSVVLCG